MTRDRELESILGQCSLSTRLFAKTMMPETFTRPFPTITDPIFAAIDDPHLQKICIAAHRGWGKTSIFNKAYPAKNILFRQKKFIVPISCSATMAEMQGENLKRKLQTSPRIKKFFGSIKTDPTVFSKEVWKAKDTFILPRGSGQQVRGMIGDDDRPDLIVIDDLEDRDTVKNPDLRKEQLDWFEADVVNCVDRSSKDWKIVIIGTILHEDSLLMRYLRDDDWYHMELALCNENYESNFPDFMTTEEVRALAESYARRGQLDIFHMEYMNSVIPADAVFQQSMFKYYDEDTTMTYDQDIQNIVIVDPAKTTNMGADYSAIIGIGVNLQEHEHTRRLYVPSKRPEGIYIRDIINDRLHPDECYEAAYQMCMRMGAHVIGVEVTGLNEYIEYPFVQYFKKKGFSPEFVWLKSPGGPKNYKAKETRVKSLGPFYRMGLMYHNKACCKVLETQLISFPRSKHWDVMDALSYVIEMLHLGDRYMPPNEEDLKKTEEIFEDINEDYEYESEDWRII